MVLYLLAGLLWFIAIACFVAAVVSLSRALPFRSRGVEIDGRVIGHELDSEGGTVTPVIEYVVAGAAYRVGSNLSVAKDRHPVGNVMRVVYLPDDPSSARVAGGLEIFTPAMALSIVAIIFGALASALTYALI